MSLTPAERRALARIEDSLRVSDPRLAATLATFALPGSGPKIAALVRMPRRITRARHFIVAALALAAMCVLFVGAVLQGGGGDPLCIPGARVITGGQALNCPPAAGPPARRSRPARNGGTGRLPASHGASGW
jgi:hypothetical protein